MAKIYAECAACGIQERSDNDVRVWNKLLADSKPLCYQRGDGEKTCTTKVQEAVSEWAESQGQQELGDFL
jgi:hypothetical protein